MQFSAKLYTLLYKGSLQATVVSGFCLILRISLAWKTNSSVMESSLMKALSFAGFKWGKNSGNRFVILHKCRCEMQAYSGGVSWARYNSGNRDSNRGFFELH